MVSRFSRQPSWIAERNYFRNSESLCRFDASHRFSSIRLTVWEEMSFEEEYKMVVLGYGSE